MPTYSNPRYSLHIPNPPGTPNGRLSLAIPQEHLAEPLMISNTMEHLAEDFLTHDKYFSLEKVSKSHFGY